MHVFSGTTCVSSNTYTNKNHVDERFWTPRKAFAIRRKIVIFQDHIMIGGICSLIYTKKNFLIFFEMFPKHVKMGWKFEGTLKLSVYLIHFKKNFQEFETFKTSYLSIINYLQLFSIFSLFLFLLVLFKLTPLWIVMYLIEHHWLCFIINVWLRTNSHFQRKEEKI